MRVIYWICATVMAALTAFFLLGHLYGVALLCTVIGLAYVFMDST